MSDRLDSRIRELYAELTDASPNVPPLPAPQRRVGRRPVVRLAALAAAVLLVAGSGVALLTQIELGGSDDAAAPAATAAPGTQAPSRPGDSADTVVGAPEQPPGTSRPRQVDRILLLADLNGSCSSARGAFATEIGSRIVSEDDYRAAFVLFFDELEELRLVVEDANTDSADAELLALGDQITTAQGAVILGGEGLVAPRYADAVAAISTIGTVLAEFGALDCGDLGSDLP